MSRLAGPQDGWSYYRWMRPALKTLIAACGWCANSFEVIGEGKRYRFRRGDPAYCSTECQRKGQYAKVAAKMRGRFLGDRSPRWKGNVKISRRGICIVLKHGHHLSSRRGRAMMNRLLVESRTGRNLKREHHVLRCGPHLVVGTSGYGKTLKRRRLALEATGDPKKRRCPYCGRWDDTRNMRQYPSASYFVHPECNAAARWADRAHLRHVTRDLRNSMYREHRA